MGLSKDNIEVDKQYEITEQYHGDRDPYILTLRSIGAANACFEGDIPTRKNFRTFILLNDIPKYVKPHNPRSR